MWRGPATILDVEDAGMAAERKSQTFKAARFCVRRKVGAQEVGGSGAESHLGEFRRVGWHAAGDVGRNSGGDRLA